MTLKTLFSSALLALSVAALGACGGDSSPDSSKCPACGDDLVCDPEQGICVECLNNYNCEAPTAICRTTDHVCVECLNSSQCPNGWSCNLGVCEHPQTDPECSISKPCTAPKTHCDLSLGKCVSDVVQCTPDNQAETCPGSECTSEGKCLNVKRVACDASNTPAHATSISEQVTIYWTSTAGWTPAAKCAWLCDDGWNEKADKSGCEQPECSADRPCTAQGMRCDLHQGKCVADIQCTHENQAETCPGSECTSENKCLNEKKVACDASNTPEHATPVSELVSISWTASAGWTQAAKCGWLCEDGWQEKSDKSGCEKAPECTSNDHCFPDGVCQYNGSCLTSRQEDCSTRATPTNATAQVEKVTITWTAGIGWSSPAACSWSCDDGYVPSLDGKKCEEAPECTANSQCSPDGECVDKSCLGQKEVACKESGKPANSSYVSANVTITWTAGVGWSTPALCHWRCNDPYTLNAQGTGCEKAEEPPACTPGTCDSATNSYCKSDKTEQSCGNDVCLANRGCVECIRDTDCGGATAGKYCTASNTCAAITCTGCTATYETCDTSTHTNGRGTCIPASCSSNTCSGEYACIGGKYAHCEHGCQSNACKAAPVGCAAESNPDAWCRNNSLDGDYCELATGTCIECLSSNQCGAGQECYNKTCRALCGNGSLNSDEQCESGLPTSQWRYASCDALIWGGGTAYQHFVGTLTCDANCQVGSSGCTLCGNGVMDSGEECDPQAASSAWNHASCSEVIDDTEGDLSCNSDCTLNIDGCTETSCYGVQADEECTSYNGGNPQPCDVYFFGKSNISSTNTIVCTAASASCPSRLVIDDEATLEACLVAPPEPVPVNWCSTRGHYNGRYFEYTFTVNADSPSHIFYGLVNVPGVTGTAHPNADSSNIRGQLVLWDSEFNPIYINGTRNAGFNGDGSAENDEWSAVVTGASVSATGAYHYLWRFTADNGTSWYYCKNDCSGTCAVTDDTEWLNYEYNVVNITKSNSIITENFANMTNRSTCAENTNFSYSDTGSFTGAGNVTWSYKGFACAYRYTGDETSRGIGIGQRSTNGNFITASGFTGGIGEMVVTYKFANTAKSATLQVFVNNSTTEAAHTTISGNRQGSNGFGTATLTVNSATATSFTLRATKDNDNDTFVITEVTWTGV